jgi:predicted homoserine dehydrogenase-like protein
MIIIDNALRERKASGKPVCVGMTGAGFAARGIARNMIRSAPGMHLAVIVNRSLDRARQAFLDAGVTEVTVARDAAQITEAAAYGRHVVTDDPNLMCQAEGIEAVMESTGDIAFGATVASEAIANGKHVVANAELTGTLGPILKVHADRAGVIFSGCDGDQPAVQMNLYRHLRSVGLTPLVSGNIKGLQDYYRTPETQKAFGNTNGISAVMATNFADGTKISLEQAEVANATGMKVARRGMLGHEFRARIEGIATRYDHSELRRMGGIVDYALGAEPGPGVFIVAAADDPEQQRYLKYCKMGDGPLYTFYMPFHLICLEAHLSLARAVLCQDAAITPLGRQVVDVVATAKRDLAAGELLDGIGGFTVYGLCENAPIAEECRLLPVGLSVGCRLLNPILKDQVICYDDVELPENSLVHRLRREQDKHFGSGLIAE